VPTPARITNEIRMVSPAARGRPDNGTRSGMYQDHQDSGMGNTRMRNNQNSSQYVQDHNIFIC